MQAYIISLVDPESVPEPARPYLKESKHGPHVTLLYIGEVDDIKDDILDAALRILIPRIEGKFGGVGRFSGSEASKGLDVFYLSVDSPLLFSIRSRLIKELALWGITPDNSHGFVPHMTVKFLEASEPQPFQRIEAVPVDLSNIRVVVGKEYVDLKSFDQTRPETQWRFF